MKRSLLLLASLVLACGAAVAHAGSNSTHHFGGSAGLVAPTGDFADAAGAGWFLGGSYNYRFHPRWAAGVDLEYFSFGDKSMSTALTFGTSTFESSAYGGVSQFYAKYFIPMQDDRIEPYFKAGYFHHRIGFKSSVTYRGVTSERTDKELDPGFGFGIGATRKLNDQSRAGLELLYSQIQASGESASYWQIGLNYYFKLRP